MSQYPFYLMPYHGTTKGTTIKEMVDPQRCTTCSVIAGCMLEQSLADTLYARNAREGLNMLTDTPGWLATYRFSKAGMSPEAALEKSEIQTLLEMSSFGLLDERSQPVDPLTRIKHMLGDVHNTRLEASSKEQLPKVLKDALTGIDDDARARTDLIRFGNDKTFVVIDFSDHTAVKPPNRRATTGLISDFVRLLRSPDQKGDPQLINREIQGRGKTTEIEATFEGDVIEDDVIVRINGGARGCRTASGLYVAYLHTERNQPDRVVILGSYDEDEKERFLRDTGIENLINPSRR